MSKAIITFDAVTKSFTKHHQKTLKEMVHAIFHSQKTQERITAISDMTFHINQGETVGIIGRNGAGKSTLLKLIAGVTECTHGTVSIREPVYPLIELGAGFHPELTGKENVFLNGIILGMTEKEVMATYDDIVAFAELADAMDTPVKYYSSGMYMRLAFAVATCRKPKILLVDEILAVGDQSYQHKCMARMREYQAAGTTIIFVSHDETSIRDFCDRVIYLKKGTIAYDGPVDAGLAAYQSESI